jgi:hypothetical protein
MKTSCIHQPANEPLVIIRQWQIEFSDGNTTAAALLSFFEYWHNVKLDAAKQNQKANDVAAAHGEQPSEETSLYQWHTEDDLAAGIMGIAKSPKTIAAALNILVEKGAISIHRNPSPRFKFDNTRHFLFYPDVVNSWLENRSGNFTLPSSKNAPRQGKKGLRSGKNTETISEITPEITPDKQTGATPVLPAKTSKPVKAPEDKEPETVAELLQSDDPLKPIIGTFLEKTGMSMPGKKTDVGFWWSEIREIHLIGHKNTRTAQALVSQAIDAMRRENLSINSPKSIVGTARRLAGEQNGNGHTPQTQGRPIPTNPYTSDQIKAAAKRLEEENGN